jgi:hypothetical protein
MYRNLFNQDIQPNTHTYEEEIHYVCINSSDRDTGKYSKVNNYKIDLQDIFKNVHSIEIVAGSVANKNSVQSYPYLIIKLDGLDHLTFSNNNINKGFSLLYLKPTSGAHVQPELGCLQRNVRIFKTPLASLSSVSLQLLKPDGTLFDFGEADGNTAVEFQNSFVLKIITKETTRIPLQQTNVYY